MLIEMPVKFLKDDEFQASVTECINETEFKTKLARDWKVF